MDADDESAFPDDAEFPLANELDLHGLPPKLVPDLVDSYLEEASRLGFAVVRIIHGKGTGVQRERVRALLERSRFVASYGDAPSDRGGWGATLVKLATQAPVQPSKRS